MADSEGMLINTAKAIGKAAGKVASLAGVKGEAEADAPQPAKKIAAGKFEKKNKQRLPRRQKKAAKKTQARNARSHA
jgi:hypothetical protein